MGDLSEIISGIDQLELLIIKVAEVAAVALVCLIGVKTHYRKLRQKRKPRDRS